MPGPLSREKFFLDKPFKFAKIKEQGNQACLAPIDIKEPVTFGQKVANKILIN